MSHATEITITKSMLPIHWLFLWTETKGKSLREVALFFEKTNAGEVGNSKRKQYSVP